MYIMTQERKLMYTMTQESKLMYTMKTLFLFSDIPVTTQVLPLTPGTSQKMSQALLDSFKSFEKVQYDIPKGMTNNK
jgi:hypothetical protein